MDRRSVIKHAGIAGVLAAGAAPAVHAQPTVRWRLTSSFPKSLDTIHGAADVFAKKIGEMSGGKFQVTVHAPGELVPALGVVDAVQQGTVEAGHTCAYYYFGKDDTFAIGTAIPFGLNSRQLTAWYYQGNGLKLFNEFYDSYNMVSFPMGNSGAQMGGWYRREIKSLADLKGLKIRIPGFGAEIFSRLGALPQSLPGGEIYPSLERGAIDAAEWTVPYDDEKLGFYKVAKYYYYPGWWETGAHLVFYVNRDQWAALPPSYQAAFEVAAKEAHLDMLALYDARNPPALQRLIAGGAELRRFPDDVLLKAYETAHQVYAEEAAKNPTFKRLYDSMMAFQARADAWWGVAETPMSNFRQAVRRMK